MSNTYKERFLHKRNGSAKKGREPTNLPYKGSNILYKEKNWTIMVSFGGAWCRCRAR